MTRFNCDDGSVASSGVHLQCCKNGDITSVFISFNKESTFEINEANFELITQLNLESRICIHKKYIVLTKKNLSYAYIADI